MKNALKIFVCIVAVIITLILAIAGLNYLNRPTMIEYIDSFQAVEYENRLTPEFDENGVPYFVTDGEFKVMQLTDVHIGGGFLSKDKDKKAINAVAAMITAEKPDLVVVTGDISYAVPWGGSINNSYGHEFFTRLMENLGVYYTITLGNHDSEIYDLYNRAAVAEMYENESLEHCLFTDDDGNTYGYGNHVINVKNTKGLITKTLVMMDTNSYTEEDPLGLLWDYDNIHEDQIEWYRGVIDNYSSQNRALLDSMPESERPENIEEFETVQSLLFIHIPLLEVREAYNEYLEAGEKNTDDITYIRGEVGEKAPYVYSSEREEQMFETILELGSTKAMFYGHDHLNNIVLEYKGVILCYGYSIDYFAYAGIDKMGSQRGCTIINCSPDTSFEIIHENYYQDKYVPLYEKEVVDLTN